MAEAKARRWRFVIKAYEPGAVEERARPAKGPHSFDKALKAGACSMYRLKIEVKKKGKVCFVKNMKCYREKSKCPLFVLKLA